MKLSLYDSICVNISHLSPFNLNLNLQARTGGTKFSTKRYFNKEQNEGYHPERERKKDQTMQLPCCLARCLPSNDGKDGVACQCNDAKSDQY